MPLARCTLSRCAAGARDGDAIATVEITPANHAAADNGSLSTEHGFGAPLNRAHLVDGQTGKLAAAEYAADDSAQADHIHSDALTTDSKPAGGEQLGSAGSDDGVKSNGAASHGDDGGTNDARSSTPSSPVAAVKGWLSGAFAAVTGAGKHSTSDAVAAKAADGGEQADSPADAAAVADDETGQHDADAATATPEAATAAAAANGNMEERGTDAEAQPPEAAATEATPAADTEAPQAAPAGPAPGSIAAKIAALRAGAAKRSPDAPPPKFGLRLPFVTAESRAVGSAAASTAPTPIVSAPPVAPAAAAAAVLVQSPATIDTVGDAPAADVADDGGPATDTATASASMGDANGSAAADAHDATPAPSPVRIVARQVRGNSLLALPSVLAQRCVFYGG
jgi:hypothetical protein